MHSWTNLKGVVYDDDEGNEDYTGVQEPVQSHTWSVYSIQPII